MTRATLILIASLGAASLWSCGFGEVSDRPQETLCRCQAPQQCIDGQCVLVCQRNEDCAIGEVCDGGTCREVDPCTTAEDCADEEACIDGGCYEAPCQPEATRPCQSECGSGLETCADGQFSGCTAPLPGSDGCPPVLPPLVQRLDLNTSESLEAMIPVSDGLILAGRTDQGESSNEAWLIKLDLLGQPVWQVATRGPQWDQLNALVQVGGELLAFGQTQRRDGDTHDGLFQRHGADGTLLQARTLNIDGPNALTGAAVTESGRVILSGRAVRERAAIWVVGLDAQHEVAWQRLYDGPDTDQGYAAAARPGGGAVVVGVSAGLGGNGTDAAIIAVNDEGRTLWKRTWGGPSTDQAWAVSSFDGVIYVAGHTRSFGQGSSDAFVLAIDPGGQLLWQRILGTDKGETVSAAVATPRGVFVAGRAEIDDDIDAAWLFMLDHQGKLQWERRLAVDDFQTAQAMAAVHDTIAWGGFSSGGASDIILSITPADGAATEGCAPLDDAGGSLSLDEGSTLGDAQLSELSLEGDWIDLNVTSQDTALRVVPSCGP